MQAHLLRLEYDAHATVIEDPGHLISSAQNRADESVLLLGKRIRNGQGFAPQPAHANNARVYKTNWPASSLAIALDRAATQPDASGDLVALESPGRPGRSAHSARNIQVAHSPTGREQREPQIWPQ